MMDGCSLGGRRIIRMMVPFGSISFATLSSSIVSPSTKAVTGASTPIGF
jgi:hypothetical protein